MRNGLYRVWLNGPQGRETGALVLKDGVVFAADRLYAYNGTYREQNGKFTGEVTAKRLLTNELAVNLPDQDVVHIVATGKAGNEIALLEGHIEGLPGVTMTYELAFLREL
jgi:hypothetical protein